MAYLDIIRGVNRMFYIGILLLLWISGFCLGTMFGQSDIYFEWFIRDRPPWKKKDK